MSLTPNMQDIQAAAITNEAMVKFDAALVELKGALEAQLPDLSNQCRKINELLRQYPEISYLLTEEQIGQMMEGIYKEAKIQFSVVASAKGKTKDPLKKVDLSALNATANLNDIQL